MIKYTQLFILIGVFLVAILIQLLHVRRDYFVNVGTPINKQNVQELLDDFVLDLLANYQYIRKESKNVNDIRITNRLKSIGIFINNLNSQYPFIKRQIETFNYDNGTSNSLEDLKIVKDFFTYKIGINSGNSITDPANAMDLDLFTNRLKFITEFIAQKFTFQGFRNMLGPFMIQARVAYEQLTKLKRDLSNRKPADIPLLKVDLYFNASMYAVVNFTDDPSFDSMEIPNLQLNNLPGAKSVTSVIISVSDTITDSITDSTLKPVEKIEQKLEPKLEQKLEPKLEPKLESKIQQQQQKQNEITQEGMKFSELIQTLMTYSPLNSQNTAKAVSKTEPVPAPVDAKKIDSNLSIEKIKSTIHEEIQSELNKIKKGPKDSYNSVLSNRSIEPTVPSTPKTNSDCLQQGSWFRTEDSLSPYAKSQQQLSTNPVDMSQYIRKDSIPCYGCNIK